MGVTTIRSTKTDSSTVNSTSRLWHHAGALASAAAALLAAALLLAGCGAAITADREAAHLPVTPCRPSELQVTLASRMAGTLHYLNIYALKNTGADACLLKGYPRVTAFDPARKQIPIKVEDATDSSVYPKETAVTDVTVQPGASAGLYVGALGVSCDPASLVSPAFDVTPPGASEAVTTANTSFDVCAGETIYVSPFLPNATPPSSG